MPRITIAKFKEAKFLSEETRAFSCDVLLDGKKVCNASNDGHGGGNHYFPRTLLANHLDVITAELAERGEDATFEPLDALIEALIADKELTAQAKKMAKKGHPFSVFFFDHTEYGWRMQGRFVAYSSPEQVARAIAESTANGTRVVTPDGPQTITVVPKAAA